MWLKTGKQMKIKYLSHITTVAVLLALFVVMLGAYTRLTDAGLGCPDWPGCYGRMVLPAKQPQLDDAQKRYPTILIEKQKAWTEMAHRYAAGTLAILIFTIFILALRQKNARIPRLLPAVLVGLVFFQALLGMWTVTLKLLPVVVMAHLLGGILIFSCLFYFRLQLSRLQGDSCHQNWRLAIGLGMVIVFLQIALGGWVSSNYAGVACIGFPTCNGQWLPELYFSKGFNLFSPVGENYQGGLLDHQARMTIQFIHRLGALVTVIYILLLSLILAVKTASYPVRVLSILAAGLVVLQVVLGILNVVYLLPLWVAVAHNGVAAMLLATLFGLYYLAKRGAVHAS